MFLLLCMIASLVGFIFVNRELKYKIFLPLFVMLLLISATCIFELERLTALVCIALSFVVFIFLVWLMNTIIEKRKEKTDLPCKLWGSIVAVSLSFLVFIWAFVFNGIFNFDNPSEYFKCYGDTAFSHYILPAKITEKNDRIVIYSAFEARSEYLMIKNNIMTPSVETEVFWYYDKLVFNQYSNLSGHEGLVTVTREYSSKRKLNPVESPYETLS